MKPVSVFPGRVKSIVSKILWREYHLLVYATDDGEIVVLDDGTILDIIPLNKTSGDAIPAGAISRESGNLVVCVATKALVYEAIAFYGQDPRWEKLTSFEVEDEIQDAAWANSTTFLVTTRKNDLVAINYKENRVVWRKHMGVNKLVVCEETGLAVSYGAQKLFVVRFDQNSENLDCSFVTSIESGNVRLVWFVSPSAIAVETEEGVVFIWGIESPIQLLASLPRPANQRALLAAPSYDNSVLLANGGQSARLILIDAYTQVEEIDIGINFSIYKSIMGSVDRLYAIKDDGEMQIFAISETSVTRPLGRVRGLETSGAVSNLSVGKDHVVAGASILSPDYEIVSGPLLQDIVLTEFIGDSNKLLIVTTSSDLQLFVNGQLSWSQKLARLPKAVGGSHDQVYVLYSDAKIDTFDEDSGQPSPCSLSTEISHLDRGVISGFQALISSANTVECWDLLLDKLDSKLDYDDSKIAFTALSPHNSVFVAYSRSGESWIQFWNTQSNPIPTTISLGSCSVVSAAWSVDSKCLAVLSTNSLIVYAAVSRFRGNLIKIAETPVTNNSLTRFLLNTSIAWSRVHTGQLLIFNGKQLLVIELDLDSYSQEALNNTALELEPGQTRLTYLVSELNTPIPIYHPNMLIMCMQALQPHIVMAIIRKLAAEIKYGDLNEAGDTVLLHPSLKIDDFESLDQHLSDTLIDEERIQELQQNLTKYRLRGLTQDDQGVLRSLISLTPRAARLDNYGFCALSMAATTEKRDFAKFWSYAWFSETKSELSAALELVPQADGDAAAQVNVWLDRDDLQSHLYQIARKKFAETRDPTTVMLLYVALHKLPDLLKLWRIASGHPEREKTLKLLNNDFETPRWKTAAQKNAYALLGRHRYEYAAAFFLLGDSVKDCCQVCIDKLNNFPLAIAIMRVYEGDHGDGMKFLRDRYFGGDHLRGENSLWLQFFIEWLAQEYSTALNHLVSGTYIDCSAVFPFSFLGGQVTSDRKQQWSGLYEQLGVLPAFANALIKPLSTQKLPETTENNADEECTSVPDAKAQDFENRDLPSHLKAAPTAVELEPDMSAFGF